MKRSEEPEEGEIVDAAKDLQAQNDASHSSKIVPTGQLPRRNARGEHRRYRHGRGNRDQQRRVDVQKNGHHSMHATDTHHEAGAARAQADERSVTEPRRQYAQDINKHQAGRHRQAVEQTHNRHAQDKTQHGDRRHYQERRQHDKRRQECGEQDQKRCRQDEELGQTRRHVQERGSQVREQNIQNRRDERLQGDVRRTQYGSSRQARYSSRKSPYSNRHSKRYSPYSNRHSKRDSPYSIRHTGKRRSSQNRSSQRHFESSRDEKIMTQSQDRALSSLHGSSKNSSQEQSLDHAQDRNRDRHRSTHAINQEVLKKRAHDAPYPRPITSHLSQARSQEVKACDAMPWQPSVSAPVDKGKPDREPIETSRASQSKHKSSHTTSPHNTKQSTVAGEGASLHQNPHKESLAPSIVRDSSHISNRVGGNHTRKEQRVRRNGNTQEEGKKSYEKSSLKKSPKLEDMQEKVQERSKKASFALSKTSPGSRQGGHRSALGSPVANIKSTPSVATMQRVFRDKQEHQDAGSDEDNIKGPVSVGGGRTRKRSRESSKRARSTDRHVQKACQSVVALEEDEPVEKKLKESLNKGEPDYNQANKGKPDRVPIETSRASDQNKHRSPHTTSPQNTKQSVGEGASLHQNPHKESLAPGRDSSHISTRVGGNHTRKEQRNHRNGKTQEEGITSYENLSLKERPKLKDMQEKVQKRSRKASIAWSKMSPVNLQGRHWSTLSSPHATTKGSPSVATRQRISRHKQERQGAESDDNIKGSTPRVSVDGARSRKRSRVSATERARPTDKHVQEAFKPLVALEEEPPAKRRLKESLSKGKSHYQARGLQGQGIENSSHSFSSSSTTETSDSSSCSADKNNNKVALFKKTELKSAECDKDIDIIGMESKDITELRPTASGKQVSGDVINNDGGKRKREMQNNGRKKREMQEKFHDSSVKEKEVESKSEYNLLEKKKKVENIRNIKGNNKGKKEKELEKNKNTTLEKGGDNKINITNVEKGEKILENMGNIDKIEIKGNLGNMRNAGINGPNKDKKISNSEKGKTHVKIQGDNKKRKMGNVQRDQKMQEIEGAADDIEKKVGIGKKAEKEIEEEGEALENRNGGAGREGAGRSATMKELLERARKAMEEKKKKEREEARAAQRAMLEEMERKARAKDPY